MSSRNISISYNRTFSFTDDSALVNLPPSSVPSVDHMNLPRNSLFLRSLNPSYQLFTIRLLQSKLYHERHSASRSPIPADIAQSQSFNHIVDAYRWFMQVPPTLPPQQSRVLLQFFQLELFFTQILALAASPKVPNNGAYNKSMIVPIGIEYILQLAPTLSDPDWHPFFTFAEVLRVTTVATAILDALWSNYEAVLAGWLPPLPPNLQPPPPQMLVQPLTDSKTNISRLLSALESTLRILDMAQQRWGYRVTETKETYERESAVMISKLKLRLDQGNVIATQPITTPPQMQPVLATAPLGLTTKHSSQQSPVSCYGTY